jgi:hypothetical protein
MAHCLVTCILKRGGHYNPHERISHIGNSQSGWLVTEDSAIRRIETGMDSFYTLVNGRQANIIVAVHNGRKYLKTDADGHAPNNLLALSDCNDCKLVD